MYTNVKNKCVFYLDSINNKESKLSILNKILCLYSTIRITQHDIYHNRWGKPMINQNKNIYFNTSHSFKRKVIVVSNSSVGIDIEKVHSFNEKKIRLFCTEKELIHLSNNKKDQIYTTIWCVKESYLKMLGCGLNLPLSFYNVTFENGIVRIKTRKNKKIDVNIDIFRENNFIISICRKNG